MARIAKSLATLRSQIDARYPNRNKSADGWIGDPAHAARKSDHNPNSAGVVQALDITHDPRNGPDGGDLAERLRASRDPRIKYIISRKRIAASYATGGAMPWAWRPYTGANAHTAHTHVSVVDSPAKYDDAMAWNIFDGAVQRPPEEPKPVTRPASQLQRMAKAILDYEARKDKQGRLQVYKLPANDGGGTYEVAGINDRYHPEMAAKLKGLIDAGKHAEAETEALAYILAMTKIAEQWTRDVGVEFYLRDCVFNRGAKGAARILQRAVKVKDDGAVGPVTRAAVAKLSPDSLLNALRSAREDYEKNVVGYRANLWRGLVNRWNKALDQAKAFQAEMPNGPELGTAGSAITGGIIVATEAARQGYDPSTIAFIVGAAFVLAVIAYGAVKQWRADKT